MSKLVAISRDYRPADLIAEVTTALENLETDGYTFDVNVLRHGMDNWSVEAIIWVFAPDGRDKKLKLQVHDTF